MPAQERLDSYAFHFLQDVSAPPIQLTGVGRELRCSADYCWENRQRSACLLLQYTLSGCGMVRVGSEVHRVPPGTAFLLSIPDDTAYYFDPDAAEDWEFVFMLFQGEGVMPYMHYIHERSGCVFPLPPEHPAAQQLLDLHAQARDGLVQDAFTASSRCFSILCALCSPHADREHRISPLIASAIAFMQANYSRGIGIADLCEQLCVSHSHLSRAFARETGMQPILYLTRLRLEEAVRLLNATDLSICDISSRCGFDNGNYFSKVFRKHMGTSPRLFRQRLHDQQYSSVQI